jgi:hypothetical protein
MEPSLAQVKPPSTRRSQTLLAAAPDLGALSRHIWIC